MCLGIPGRIIETAAADDLAVVDVAGVSRWINTGLLAEETLQPGDWILIHLGFAVERIDQREAAASLANLQATSEAYTAGLVSRAAPRSP
ncbi:MAG TPA: HypC/HybG/HupF family hydrogenase formation chaperone [Mycobacteriales bacterium]|jgi:hydrogenase expression/formation protein HypC|nr:HypC/HybG/HupF family hydrogenase formation chaperone [Mycobacteriales bacterium]